MLGIKIFILVLAVVFTAASGLFKAIMDISSEGLFKRAWLNKNESWRYKDSYKPKWLFRTLLVWVTDGWHYYQFLFLNGLTAGIALAILIIPEWYIVYVGFIFMRVSFEISYSSLKKSKYVIKKY